MKVMTADKDRGCREVTSKVTSQTAHLVHIVLAKATLAYSISCLQQRHALCLGYGDECGRLSSTRQCRGLYA
eukprot:490-Pleurochrysis_carterae.AAC.3